MMMTDIPTLPAPAPVAKRLAPPGAAAVLPALPVPAWLPVAVPVASPPDVLSFLPPASVIPPVEELPDLPAPAPTYGRESETPPVGAVAVSAVPRAAPVASPADTAVPDWLSRIAAAPPSAADTARIEERRTSTLAELAAMTVPALIDRAAPVASRTAPAPAPARVPFTRSPAFKVGVLAVLLVIVWKVAT